MTTAPAASYPSPVPTSGSNASFVAACVQFDVRKGDVQGNFQSAVAGITAAAASGATLAVLPEMWSTSFLTRYAPRTLQATEDAERRLRELSAKLGMVLVGSSVESAPEGVFNTARVYDRGQHLGSYRKIHLFSPNAEHRHYAAGDQPLVVPTSVGLLGVVICYDLRFPELTRYCFHRGCEVLAVPSQWPEARAVHWRTLARARAIENQCFVVGCNRTGHEGSLKNDDPLAFPGDSRIVDPMGEVLAAGHGEEQPLLAEIELKRVRTMRRILPIEKDERPEVYRRLYEQTSGEVQAKLRKGNKG